MVEFFRELFSRVFMTEGGGGDEDLPLRCRAGACDLAELFPSGLGHRGAWAGLSCGGVSPGWS